MAYFLFIDESGHDQRASPYEVLAGIAIPDRQVWPLVQALHAAEVRCFGRRYSANRAELKAARLLKAKVFRHAAQLPPLSRTAGARLAAACLNDGTSATRESLTALAQAKLAYVSQVLALCQKHECRIFATMVPRSAPRPSNRSFLRKDYAYLFERYFNFLAELDAQGCVVFDEIERSASHLLTGQMEAYFKHTAKGRTRARFVIPEPLFVHSDLTTGVQIADLVAYILSWGFRAGSINEPARPELAGYAAQVATMRHLTIEHRASNPLFQIWSVAHITDLRSRADKP